MRKGERLFVIVVIVVSIVCLATYFSKKKLVQEKEGRLMFVEEKEDTIHIEAKEEREPEIEHRVIPPQPPLIPKQVPVLTPWVTDKDKEIKALISVLESSNWNASYEAANKLTSLGKDAVSQLVGSLEGASVALKGQIVFILGRIGDKGAGPILMEALQDDNAYIRRNVAEALGKIKDERALNELAATLFDDDSGVRERSAWALGELNDPRIVGDLIDRMVDEKEERVKSAVVNALAKLKDDWATGALLTELKSQSDLLYKNEVVTALGEIGDSRALSDLIEYIDQLKQYKPTEPVIIFQLKEAIRIAEEAIQKIEEKE